MKKIKKFLLASMAFACLASTVGGICSYNVQGVAQTEKTGFFVEDGAAVRLKSEHEKFGIKFSANVGQQVDGATYNMLIVPVELVELYESDTDEKKADIITYLQAYAKSKGGELSIVKNCEVKDGKISGAIVNVLWKNINRKFVGVAYYEKNGAITVAQYADDKERSIVEVSENALNSGDYTQISDIQVLVEKLRYGEMLANGATEAEKQSKAYQYEQFYGASVNGDSVTTAAGTKITLSDAVGSVQDNALKLISSGSASATINFGEIPAGAYRVQLEHSLLSGAFTSTVTQNETKTLATVWDMKEIGENLYEFYFNQEMAGNASFTLSTQTAGAVTLDNVALEPVSVQALEYSREKYMFGIGGLASEINGSQGAWCDSNVTSEWVASLVERLGVESQRVWLSVTDIITRAENSNELILNQSVANEYHKHIKRLRAAGVQRITMMLSRYIYPYGYNNDATQCVPDPNKEASDYKAWLEMQYRVFTMLAKEFPEITLWECGNEYDLDTYIYKNGLKSKNEWELARNYTFKNTEKAYITADICYAASKAFKLYNPESQIILPGMSKYAADKSNDHISLSSANKKYYFEELYNHIESGKLPTLETTKITNPDKYFDIIAYHAYASSVDEFEAYNDRLLATAAAHGDGDKRVWITELGFSESVIGTKSDEETQNTIAELMLGLLQSLEQEKYANLIETVHFFRMSDTIGLQDSSESCYGIYHSPNATEKSSQAKPLAVTLYNYFNGGTATASELFFWKDSLTTQDFENATWADTNLLKAGADITFKNTSAELIDYNGGKALQVTKTAMDYAYVMFAFGAVEKGTYELTLDAITQNGYAAVVQCKAINGATLQESIYNYSTLFTLAKKDGNTYVLRLSIQNDYESFGVALASSSQTTVGEQIIIDNVSFKKTNVIQTIDFESGIKTVAGVSEKDKNASISAGHAVTHISTDGTGAINLPNELVEEENGNHYFTINYKGWSSWSAFNFGFFKAGTYTITMDVKLLNGETNGNFIKRVNNVSVALEEGVDYTVDGDTYVFKITLEEDCMNFGIGYQCFANQNANFTLGYDNIDIVIGSNEDGGVNDSYDWLNHIN